MESLLSAAPPEGRTRRVVTRSRAALLRSTISSLPEPVLELIFQKIDDRTALFSCARVCKTWLRIVCQSVLHIYPRGGLGYPRVEELRRSLALFTNLTELSLIQGSATTRVLQCVGSSCPTLHKLQVPASTAKDPGLKAIAKGCPRLQSLDLFHSKHFTAAGIRPILQSCTELKELHIDGCPWVRKPVLDALAQSSSKIRMFSVNAASLRCGTMEISEDIRTTLFEVLRKWKSSLQVLSLGGMGLLPNDLGCLSELEDLRLPYSLTSSLPQSIGHLQKLKVLELDQACNLSSLPEAVGQLKALERLRVINSDEMTELPSSLAGLKALTCLDLTGCMSLSEVPNAICQLTNLVTLQLGACTELLSIPQAIGNLESLEVLDLSECSNLLTLPGSIGQLKKLRRLLLEECNDLESLPATIGDLTNLKELDLTGCSDLVLLPESLGHLPSLETLELTECDSLRGLPPRLSLPSLKELKCADCVSLRTLPADVGRLPSLERLDVSYCSQLRGLPKTLRQAPALKELILDGCGFSVPPWAQALYVPAPKPVHYFGWHFNL